MGVRSSGGDLRDPVAMPSMPLFVTQKKPHFFRIFFPEQYGSELKIPQSFIKHISSEKHQIISLFGPSQSVWNVELATDDSGTFFRNGWPEFVADHCLNEKEFLLFRYDGNLHFTVKIFDGSACEKATAFYASSCQDLAIIGDSQTLKKSLVNVVEDLCASPQRDYLLINSETAGESHLSEADNGCSVKTPVRDDGERSHLANTSSMPYQHNSQGFHDHKTMDGLSKPVHSESSRRKRGRPRKTDISKELARVNLSTAKEILCMSDDGADDLQQELIIKEEPIEFIELPNLQQISCIAMGDGSDKKERPVYESFNKNSPSLKKRLTTGCSQLDTALSQKKRDSSKSTNGQDSARTRIGTLVSNRRPVSPDEVMKAYESARSFTSEHPSVVVVMRESYVCRGFYLNLPTTFVKEHLPNHSRKLKLWSPNGEPWIVNYVACNGYGGLSARWSAFAIAHNLEVDDVCVFELFRKYEMRVHIFRVVEEVTPLTTIPGLLCQPDHDS